METMKTIKLLLLMILCSALAGVAPAIADDLSGDDMSSSDMSGNASYFVIKGGTFYPAGKLSIDNFNGPASSGLNMQNGLNGELALGQYSDSGSLASELGIGYFESEGSPSGEPGSARLTAVPVYITWKFISSPGGLNPYLALGLGGYYTTLQVRGNTGSVSTQSKVTYGFHGGVGFNINLGSAMFIGVEGRYVWVKDFGGRQIDLNGITTSINIGFEY